MSRAGTSYSSDFSDGMKRLAAGGTAAAISKTTTAPIDRVKLILQVQGRNGTTTIAQQHYSGMRDCFSRIFAEQGMLALWRGNSAAVARCFPNHALNFAFRDLYRNMFLTGIDRKTNFWAFFGGTVAAGGAGGATTLLILYPMDFARTRMAVDVKRDGTKRFSGMTDCLLKIQQKEGMRSWYRGFIPSMQFVVASRAVFFGLFDVFRTKYTSQGVSLHFAATWAIAQTCLVISGLSCYPMDTVRRRLMVEVGQTNKKYKSTLDCWRTIARVEGANGFYKGALTNSLRSTGGALIISLYYEFAKYM